MNRDNLWAEFLHMIKADIRAVENPDDLLDIALVIVGALYIPDTQENTQEPQDNDQ